MTRTGTRPLPPGARRSRWAVLWAGAGVLSLLAQAWVIGRWAADGNLSIALDGNTGIPVWREALTWTGQGMIALALLAMAVLAVRECRRTRSITLNTALWAGLSLCFWQDPLLNYAAPAAAYSRAALHLPSLGPYLPGWHGPRPEQEIAVPLGSSVAGWFVLITWAWLISVVVEHAARHRPTWKTPRLALVGFATGLAVAFAGETLMIYVFGLYAWTGTIHALSLFGGHWYQLPLTEMMSLSALLTLLAIPLYLQRVHDCTPRFLGGALGARPAVVSLTRLLAAIGYCNVLVGAYMALNAFVAFSGDPVPADLPGSLRKD
ncbi:spirocyclase AveC family protein [Streptomyces sp. NPDC006863]|uniref:spirocyclase AveC family protein n=1 Tax=unclassified Streptomyces TaxID=2593676 RepID=UPI003406011E